jgi:predicted permease
LNVRRWFRLPVTDRVRTEADVDAELASHIEERVQRLMAKGFTEPEARAEAERLLGGLAQARYRLVHDAWDRDVRLSSRERVRAWLDDVRYAVRALRRGPVFTAVAVGSLALAFALVASTTALVDAYLLRSMPYPDADRLYQVNYALPGEPEPRGMSSLDWSALAAVVEHADDSAPTRFYIGAGADRQEVMGLLAARGSLELLDVTAASGRSLDENDYAAGAEPVLLIGHDLWRTRYGSDAGVMGSLFRTSRASGDGAEESFRIVGVLPPNFRYARTYSRGTLDFVVPLREPMRAYMVRLREGVPVAHAQQVITDAVRRAATWLPPDWSSVQLESVHEGYIATLRPVLFAITAAAVIVLIITSINLAVLMLLRALRRQKESAMRIALGAGRGHLLRMQLVESGLVCGVALLIGLAVSMTALRMLAPVVEERLGRDAPGGTMAIAINWRILLAVGAAGVLISLLLSLMPLLAPWHRRLADTLRSAGRSATDGSATRRLRSALLALQVAASLALLVGCGLMIRTVLNLVGTDLGFRTEHVLRARIALPDDRYVDPAAFLRFYDQLTERLAAYPIPWAFTNAIPFYEYPQLAIELDSGDRGGVDAGQMAVNERYFDVLGITLRHGRGFTAADRPGAEPVAIVSETLARRLAPDGRAVGRRIRAAGQDDVGVASEWRTIVGVTNDVRQTHTDTDLDDVYIPFAQAPSRYAPVYFSTDQPPSVGFELLRAEVAAIDPLVLVSGDATGSSLAAQQNRLLAGPRFLMSLLTGFALFAALLTALGVYGVTAYAVQQRQRELAIRAAVGATRRQLILLFVKDAVRTLAVGIAAGLFGAVAAGRLLLNQLHGVQPLDPLTLVSAGAFIGIVALLASWWPAARGGSSRTPFVVLNEG